MDSAADARSFWNPRHLPVRLLSRRRISGRGRPELPSTGPGAMASNATGPAQERSTEQSNRGIGRALGTNWHCGGVSARHQRPPLFDQPNRLPGLCAGPPLGVAHWLVPNADKIANLRVLRANGQWLTLWN